MRKLAILIIITPLIFFHACSAVGTHAWMDKYGIPSDVIANIKIKPPSPEIPKHLARFSGIWCGNFSWSDSPTCLAVEEIYPDSAVVWRIWGDDSKKRYTAGADKHTAKFTRDGSLFIYVTTWERIERENTYTFKNDNDQLVLIQSWGIENKRRDWATLDKVDATAIAQNTKILPKDLPPDFAKATAIQPSKAETSIADSIVPIDKPVSQPKPEIVFAKSLPPALSYSYALHDANNNHILEGGEEITLKVEVENKGKGAARNVQVILTGNQALLSYLGEKKIVEDIKAGEKKLVEFKTILPAQIPTITAELKIEVKEGRGYSPSETKMLKVAMKSATVKETLEIISELDVDVIPERISAGKKKNSFALVIGISKYREKIIPEVKYAKKDADIMARYLENVVGIPKANIKLITDSAVTKSDIEAYIGDWLPRRVNKESTVFIYYSGHGAPDPHGTDAYIVPYEGHPDFPSKLYPIKNMYESLNKLHAKDVIVMLDSCFSGTGGRSVTSVGARPLVISIANPLLSEGKIMVLAASTGNQISSDYDKVQHGLFTYYLLKGMRGEADVDGNGIVELIELYEYVKTNVSEKASLELNRDQMPLLLPQLNVASKRLKIPVAKTK